MDLPIEIKNYIENELNNLTKNELNENARRISLNYRENNRNGKILLNKEEEAIAYAVSRMPATFGAGTGTASIALNEMIEIEEINCFEREEAMIKIGTKIFSKYPELKSKTKWEKFDITKQEHKEKFDLVIASYMINEIKEEQFAETIDKLWNVTKKLLVIIEPGTVQGYKNIMKAKEQLINKNAKIIAPCMSEKCDLPPEDWCNFSCRIQRSKIHKETKSGNSPFEDEKYMYIAVGKDEIIKEKSRVIRHPLIYSGYVKLKLCTKDGIKEETITKKDKEKYKIARKIKNGECIKK